MNQKIKHNPTDLLSKTIDSVIQILETTCEPILSKFRVTELIKSICFPACFIWASGQVSSFNSQVLIFSQQQPFKFVSC